MRTEFIDINGRKIKVFHYSSGDKGTILGIHGLSGNGYSLEYYRQAFSKDYRFITMDLYGRGDSKEDGSSSGLFKHAEDIIQLINHLKLDEVILIGYSMGAFISSIVAGKTDKVKAVVLLDGLATMSEHQRSIIEPSLSRLSAPYGSKEEYISKTIRSYETLGIPDRSELRTLLAYEIEEHDNHWENKASESVIRNDWETFWQVNIGEIGKQISQPVLLVIALGNIGDNPPLFLPEHYQDTIKVIENLEVVTTEANHYTMGFEPREDINQEIVAFLNGV